MNRATRQNINNDGASDARPKRSWRPERPAQRWAPVAGPGRAPGYRDCRCRRLPPRPFLASWWLPRCRHFLCSIRVFDHRAAVRPIGASGPTGPALRQFGLRRARRLVPGLVTVIFCVALFASFFARDAIPLFEGGYPSGTWLCCQLAAAVPPRQLFPDRWDARRCCSICGRSASKNSSTSLGLSSFWPSCGWHAGPKGRCRWSPGQGQSFSAFLMAAFFVPGHDPSSVYYDTFTHCSGLMIGAALAGAVHNRLRLPNRACPVS